MPRPCCISGKQEGASALRGGRGDCGRTGPSAELTGQRFRGIGGGGTGKHGKKENFGTNGSRAKCGLVTVL